MCQIDEITERLEGFGLVPLFVLEREEDAEPLGEALIAGGLPCAEIAFRSPAAAGSIKILRQRFPEICVGAGTILTLDQANAALDAGAQFMMAPGCNPEIVGHVTDRDVLFLPGVATPSDIERAMVAGTQRMKFFPSVALGGIPFLEAIAGPYASYEIRFAATGGMTLDLMPDFLKSPWIMACGGSWIGKADWIREGRWDEVENAARQTVAAVKDARA